MGFSDQPGYQSGKGVKGADQEISEYFASEKPLEKPPRLQSFVELLVPAIHELLLHFMPVRVSFQKLLNGFKGYFAAMQSHAHTISTERCNHAGSIPDKEDMVFHLCFLFKTDLGDRHRLIKQEQGICKDLLQVRVLLQDIFLHISDRVATDTEIFGCGQVAETTLVVLHMRNAAIPVSEIMQGNQV